MLPDRQPGVLAAVAAGGALGSAARYGVGVLLAPAAASGLPWATLAVNALGCLLIGVLMVVTNEVIEAPRLVRPFLGVGFLGGFTTFATYTVEARALLGSGAAILGLGYLALTVVVALTAVAAGMAATRLVAGQPRRGAGG